MLVFQICFFVCYLTINFALQVNFYTSVGQYREEISLNDGYFQTYFTNQEYNAIIP
jgi:hypothetical protein